jgi:hypothetical protein
VVEEAAVTGRAEQAREVAREVVREVVKEGEAVVAEVKVDKGETEGAVAAVAVRGDT